MLVLLSKSQEQRWRHEAGWSFPVLRLGTSTGSEHSGAVQCLCVLSCCWGQKEASVTSKNSQGTIMGLLCLWKAQDQREGNHRRLPGRGGMWEVKLSGC